MSTRRHILVASSSAAAGMLHPVFVWADTALPKGPITLLVPFAAGGATDIVGRILAKKITDLTKITVVVDNLGGAGGVVGAQKVQRSNLKDGSMLLLGTVSTHAINPLATTPPPYDAIKDFTPVSLVASVPNVIVVHPSVKATTVKELIALLKTTPGGLNYGTSGVGTPPHLSGELFKSVAGVEMQHVPYRGGAPAMADLVSGHIPILFDVLTGAAGHIRAGSVRAIAVTTSTRSPSFPDLPTVAESGLPNYETYTWNAVFGPAALPKATADALARAFQQAVADAEVREKFKEISAVPVGSTPQELTTHLQNELAKWAPVIKSIGGLKLG